MEQLTDLKAILHSKRANIYYLEMCRVMQKDRRVLYLTEKKEYPHRQYNRYFVGHRWFSQSWQLSGLRPGSDNIMGLRHSTRFCRYARKNPPGRIGV